MIKLLITLSILLIPLQAFSTTYYVSPSGSGSTCTTGARCTITTGLGKLTPGDTLILGDGTYTGYFENDIPSGTAGNYVVVKAEHDGSAILSNTVTGHNTLYSFGMSYVQVEGLRIESNVVSTNGALGGALFLGTNANHNKFLRCAFVTTPCGTGNTACTNRSNITISGNYNLIEDSWAWGGGRYKVMVYGGDSTNTSTGSYNILRRVVVRHDREYSGSYNPQVGFQTYQAYGTQYQNCLVIDSDQEAYYDSNCHLGASCFYGAFIFAKGTKGGPTAITGSMALHFAKNNVSAIDEGDNSGAGSYGETDYPVGNIAVSNFVAYDGGGGFKGAGSGHTARVLSLDHSFIGNLNPSNTASYPDCGSGFSAENKKESIK